MALKRLSYAFILVSLLVNCSKKDSDKGSNTATDTCQGLAEGQSGTLSFYKKERADWNESCVNLAMELQGTCSGGQLLLQEEGFPTCSETLLKNLSIKAESTTLEVDGMPTLLTLEGKDQDGRSFPIDSNEAAWTSSSEAISVSADGHVIAYAPVPAVVVKAVVKDIVAELTISAKMLTPTGKSCGDTPHGGTKEFPRFKAALVNFQSTCEAYQATALCSDGQFTFKPEDSIADCRVADLKSLDVTPSVLAMKPGESRPITAEATDETGYVGTVNFQDISWTVQASPEDQSKISVAEGGITLAADLQREALVKAEFLGLTDTITLTSTQQEPKTITFEKSSYLLKSGDTVTLNVLGYAGNRPVELDPAKLVLESSDSQKVAIEGNTAKVVSAGGRVIIIAKYAGESLQAQTQISIEDELKIGTTSSKNDILTAEVPRIVAVARLKLEGPDVPAPRVESKDSACVFLPYLTQGLWTIDVKLQPASDKDIPGICEAEFSVASQAGQKASHKLKVPVRFAELKFREKMLRNPEHSSNVVAELNYRLSKNVRMQRVSIVPHPKAELTPAACKLSLRESAGQVQVLADISADPSMQFCAGFLSFVLNSNGKKETVREHVAVSPYRPFLDICEDRSAAAAQQTIHAMSMALNIRKDCALLDSLLREKNTGSIFDNRGFTLSMFSSNLTDLEPLARLTGLRELILSDNPKLTDLKPLTWLKTLERVDVDWTNVTDFSPLYHLNDMTFIDTGAESIDCRKSEVTNEPLRKLCTQE